MQVNQVVKPLEHRVIDLERTLQEHLQKHQKITKDTISDEILSNLKFSVQYTDYTYGNNTPVAIQVEYGGYLLSKLFLD